MKIVARPLRKQEIDHELIWVAVCWGSLLSLLGLLYLRIPLPSCPFHDLTGWPCLTCGATRCFIQFSKGHFREALGWNPGVFFVFLALILYNLYATLVLGLRLPRLRLESISSRQARIVRISVLALIAANWVYLLVYLPSP